ncbi:MAG: AarF/ABC1/UbiB kinase family protein [Patescibacteria group bacterium]
MSQKKTIAAIKRHRTARMAKLMTRSYSLYRRGKKDELSTLIADEMLAMGGIYVKFLQGVMLQSAIMKRWHNPDKLKIFEKLDTEPLDIVNILQANLGSKVSDIEEIQPVPFAAGTFGQVYYGKHVDGTPIIVKVLRPLIAETLKFDLKLLKRFWNVTSKRYSPNLSVDFTAAFDDFAAQTMNETDYAEEARFAAEQYEAYKDHPKLVIPRTYTDLCTPQIIVQEYVGGISASHLVEMKQQGVDPEEYVKEHLGSDLVEQLSTLGYELIWGVFSLPRIMGDPHPGNVKLLEDNRVALLDFGISARPGDNQAAFLGMIREYDAITHGRFNIVNLFSATMRFFGRDLYLALSKVSKLADKDIDLNLELSKVIKKNFEILSGGEDLETIIQSPKAITLVNKVANQNNRFALKMKVESTEMIRAIQSGVSLVDSLGLYPKVMPRVYQSVLKQIEQEQPELTGSNEPDMSVSHAIDILYGWMERVAARDPALFQSLMAKLQLKRAANKAKDPSSQPDKPEGKDSEQTGIEIDKEETSKGSDKLKQEVKDEIADLLRKS